VIDIAQGDFFNSYNKIEAHSISLILTDPPYNVSGFDRLETTKWDKSLNLSLLEEIFSKLLKATGIAIIFCDIHLFNKLYNSFKNTLEYRFHHIWEKGCGMPVNLKRPISETELIAVFKRKNTKVSDLTFNSEAMGENGNPYIKHNRTNDISTRNFKKSDYNQNTSGIRYPRTIIKAPSKPNMEKEERTSHLPMMTCPVFVGFFYIVLVETRIGRRHCCISYK